MKKNNSKVKTGKVLSISTDTLQKLDVLAQNLKSKEIFPDKVAFAKNFFKNIKSLPI